jgi:hypothetical protein
MGPTKEGEDGLVPDALRSGIDGDCVPDAADRCALCGGVSVAFRLQAVACAVCTSAWNDQGQQVAAIVIQTGDIPHSVCLTVTANLYTTVHCGELGAFKIV